MSELKGYKGAALNLLEKFKVGIGDTIKIFDELTFEGILMPRYEHSDDQHIVIKLKSGYNVGIEIDKIKKIEIVSTNQKMSKEEPVVEIDEKLPKVLVLSTGGTIASKIDYRTGGVTPALSAKELLSNIPELAKIANIQSEVLFSEYSENLMPEHWKKIAQKIDTFSRSDFRGIIIAHGTDTMHYTSSFLSFALAGFPLPVVLVGSQRSSDRPSSDAALNLIAAVRFVTQTTTKGVFVCMHHNESDDLIVCHLGTRVRKNHTSKRGAFHTIGGDPAYLILDNKIEKNYKENFFKNEKYFPRIGYDDRVILIKYYPGMNSKLVDFVVSSGYKAIIFEGTGLGHIGKTMYESVKKANEKGVFLGMTSQCIEGRVGMTVYESGRDLLEIGITPLLDMVPETALVKAMWALGISKDKNEIKNLMLENIASEFSN